MEVKEKGLMEEMDGGRRMRQVIKGLGIMMEATVVI